MDNENTVDDAVENVVEKKRISARIDADLYVKTRIYVIEHNISYEEWIGRAMTRYYNECIGNEPTGSIDDEVSVIEPDKDIFK